MIKLYFRALTEVWNLENGTGITINPTLQRRDYDVPGRDSHVI